MSDAPFAHVPVLLAEALDQLITNPNGRYLDCTFGRGGHSGALLQRLGPEGRLLALDKDPTAIAAGRLLAEHDPRFAISHRSFADLLPAVTERGWQQGVTGVLFDLGVSSPQLDDPERGFSFMRDGPLDMRMNTANGPTASQWLAQVDEAELVRVLFDFGEERFARRIAAAIVEARGRGAIARTGQLAEVIAAAHPRWEPGRHPATRAFQAIRIALNGELSDLGGALSAAEQALEPGGRLVVISFHSLEDRQVKRFMRDAARGPQLPKEIPVMPGSAGRRLKLVSKAIKPSAAEIALNVRARSAVLRAAEKLDAAERSH